MNKAAALWNWLGLRFGKRPAALLGTLIGAVIFALLMGYLVVNQDRTSNDLKSVQQAFCNGSAPYTPQIEQNCRRLLDQLLHNPTPEQARRLRQIVKESP